MPQNFQLISQVFFKGQSMPKNTAIPRTIPQK